MKKSCLLLSLIAISQMQAMEQQKQPVFDYWEQLPEELRAEILSYVAGVDSYEKLKELMTVNKKFNALLRLPAVFREFLKELIKKDKNKAEDVFVKSVQAGNGQLAEGFVNAGIDVNTKNHLGESVFSMATRYGDVELMKLLLDKGANINAQYVHHTNYTPLMLVIKEGDQLVNFLLDHGADVNITGDDGETALSLLAPTNMTNRAQLLIDKGAQVNVADQRGVTPLMKAAGSNFAMVDLLLKNGADVNAVDNNRNTALMKFAQVDEHSPWASEQGLPDIAKALIEHGAKLFAANNGSKTAYALAVAKGNTEIANILEHAMGKK